MFRILLGAAVVALAGFGPAHARPFTARDLATLDRVSDPRVSPDGRLVAYNIRSTDWEANRGWNALWVLDRTALTTPPRLIRDREPVPTSPRWSADGRWLYFLSSRSGSSQVWRAAVGSAEARPVTALPVDVSLFRLAPDGRTLVAAVTVDPTCSTLACEKAKADARAKTKATGTVYDGATPRFWDTYLDGRFVSLFAVPLGDGAAATDGVALTPGYKADIVSRPEGDDSAFTITPDSKQVIFAARPSGAAQGLGAPDSLYQVSIHGGAAPARFAWSQTTSDAAPAISPDGARLAYLSQTGSTFTAPRARLMVRDLASGSVRELAAGVDRSFGGLIWSPDGATLYATAEDVGQDRLYAVDLATGAARPLTGDGHVAGVSVGRSVVVYSRDALDSPAQVFDLTKTGARQLTHVGEEILSETPMSPFEAYSFTGWNGETVHGYVVKPADYQSGRKYPVAFLIHGGPHGSFGNAWSYRWNPQVWSGMGYAVVMVDFHGSSGYGEAFAKSIVGHWGDRPLEDLQKGWAYALAHYAWLDGDRACALGGSYGGYMVAWIAGAWAKPWRCLVDHDGVFDVRLMSYSTDIPGFQQAQNDAPTWEKPEYAERFNPIDHVADWTQPILVVHSGRDDRVPLDQGMGAYGAAQLRHVPSELLYFPDENHWVLKPQNSVQWYATVEAWMKRWLADGGASATTGK
jgi:acylaminoacyl-peptidase